MGRELATLNLPGKLTRTSWALPSRLSIEDWLECGRALEQADAAVQWWIGDWWAYGDHLYGERAKAAAEKMFGDKTFGTLKTYGTVARSITTSSRLDVLSFSHHQEVAPLQPPQQKRWLAAAVKNEWSVMQLRSEIRQGRATDRTQQVALDAAKLGRFALIYADPPWRYENQPMGGSNRSIENQYPTMTLEEICAMPVADIAHENSILFLWATAPKLAECFAVVEAWGFLYRTNAVWVKDQIGMGYHFRNQHELLLVAKRGELAAPAPESRPSSVIHATREEHSEKPEEVVRLIEQMYPDFGKKHRIELFARAPRKNWTTWGNDKTLDLPFAAE